MQYSVSQELRRKGRLALRGHWQTALVITFAAGALGTLLAVLAVALVMPYGMPLYYGGGVEEWANAMGQRLAGAGALLSLVLLAVFLLSPALSMGLNYYYLQLHRSQEARFSLLFSRMRIFGKSLGLSLMRDLLVGLWGLLYVAVMLVLVFTGSRSPVLTMLLAWASMIPMIIAALRYAMAPYLMADDPEIGVMEAIRQSKDMMAGNKGRLFALNFSFIGWGLLVSVAASVTSLITPILGTVVGLFASLALQVYTNASVSAFYLELKGESRPLEAEVQGGVE